MLDRAAFVCNTLVDRSLHDLETDRLLRSAVERELMVLGEALYQLHQHAPDLAERIEHWEDSIAFRHVLVHGYHVLKMQVVWDAIHDDLPPLIQQLKMMLTEGP